MSSIFSDLLGGFSKYLTDTGTELSKPGSLAEQQKLRQQAPLNARIGNITAGQEIPNFLRPNQTTESYTPEQFEAAKIQQLYTLGTPEAANIANKFIETPETRMKQAEFGLSKQNIESEIANRAAQRGLQKESLDIQRAELAATKAERDRNYTLAAKELEAKLKGGTTDPKEIFDRETKLRNEFVTQSKDFALQRDAFDRIKTSAKDPSAAGDLALIFNYMKLLDPGSTVREGEFANAQNAGGIPDKLQAQYNKIINGERLNDKIRNDFVDRSDRLYKGATTQHAKRTEQYKALATRAGVNPNQVIIDLGLAEQPKEVKIQGMTAIPGIKFLGFK